ncbi:MAG: hypothetical protein PWQ48_1357 [Thermotogaceae bacterium]|jgi:type I restriction enzyme M protein|nr:hypothetical protein [Thermotogaceae bacterium]
MARRNVFLSGNGKRYVKIVSVDFKWIKGLSIKQKRENIKSLHESFKATHPNVRILEISTKSEEPLGKNLSSMNLKINLSVLLKNFEEVKEKYSLDRNIFHVENVFQSCKVFENGGPYYDLLIKKPTTIKKDQRLRESGKLVEFNLFGDSWPLKPETAFYDWLYINAVLQYKELFERVVEYDAFTDIEFNPKRSKNCQARAAAMLVSLYRQSEISLKDDFIDKERFLRFYTQEMTLFNQGGE